VGGSVDKALLDEKKTLLEVAQTISLLSTLSEREKEQDVVTLSTLHASKGLEFPYVFIMGMEEEILPHRSSIEADTIEEERRLAYVGITRAQRTLSVSWTRRRKKGRDTIAAQPSRFIAEMALNQATIKEDPREKLRALRAEFAARAAATAAQKKPA
jgi:ATP-dependent DNA helicase Rep